MTMIDQIPPQAVGMQVRCDSCGGKFHEITAKFEPVPPMRGNYLRLRSVFKGRGWYAFPEQDWVVGDNVQCPQCGSPYRMNSILKQVTSYVHTLSAEGKEEVRADGGGACGPAGVAEGIEERAVGAPPVLEEDDEAGDQDENPVPAGDPDDAGIYDEHLAGDDVVSMVHRLTAGGETQASIAQTCQISVYMVRQIQLGKKG